MKFNSQICTTKEQSERLLALGLKAETADCHYEGRKNRYEEWEVAVIGGCYYSRDYPAWSLHRLIEILDIWYLDLNFHNFDNAYEQVISYFEERVKGGFINKDYLYLSNEKDFYYRF